MAEALAKQAWFVRVRTTEQPPALLDFAVGKATLQEAIAAILHRPELDLGRGHLNQSADDGRNYLIRAAT
jgi:hypothetical protein